MYKFQFLYENKSFQEFEHISKVKYSKFSDFEISESEILEHNFPIGPDMHLFAKDASYTASGKNLKSISVFKEE